MFLRTSSNQFFISVLLSRHQVVGSTTTAMPSDRHGQGQKAFEKTEDRHACMNTNLDKAMAQDDKLTERKVKTVGKMTAQLGAVCFSERTLVILATMAKMKIFVLGILHE